MDDTDNTGRSTITKSELIEQLTIDQLHLDPQDVQVSVDALLDRISRSLINGERIEIRGFGSISLRYREPRLGRNPKTGEPVSVPGTNSRCLTNRMNSECNRQCAQGLTVL